MSILTDTPMSDVIVTHVVITLVSCFTITLTITELSIFCVILSILTIIKPAILAIILMSILTVIMISILTITLMFTLTVVTTVTTVVTVDSFKGSWFGNTGATGLRLIMF